MGRRLKFNLLTLFAILFLPAIGQDLFPKEIMKQNVEGRHEPDTIVTYDKNGARLNRFAYFYDLNGNKTSEVQERYDTDKWVNVLRTSQTFDDAGNVLTLLREGFRDGVWNNSNRTVTTYDQSGNLLTQTQEMWRNEAWGGNNRTIQAFDTNGNRLTQLTENWLNNQWSNSGRNTWTYDEKGNMATRRMESWVNNAWAEQQYTTFTYDGSENLLTEMKMKDNINISRITYTYNEANHMSAQTDENFANNAWVNASRKTWIYDGSDTMTQFLQEGWGNNAWEINQRESYTYDAENNMLTKLIERKSGAVLANNMRNTWAYNGSGKQMSQLEERWSNNEWTNSARSAWSYDPAGNLLTSIAEAWRQGAWTETLDFAYTYDSKGNALLYEATLINNLDVPVYYNNSGSKCVLPGYNLYKVVAKYIEIKENVDVRDVVMKNTELSISTGKTYQLEATINPSNATNKEVNWSSSATAVASVDENGLVRAAAPGNATITVTTVDGNFTATCEVTVNIAVTGVAMNRTELALKEGETFQLEAVVAPSDALNKEVMWKSSSASYVSVDQTGKITAVRAGEATITVTTAEGNFKATCKVMVSKPVTGVALKQTELALNIGEKFQLEVTVNPFNATNKEVIWSSSADQIVLVNEEGEITAMNPGESAITVTTVDGGFKAICKVTVGAASVTGTNSGEARVYVCDGRIVVDSETEITDLSIRDVNGKELYQTGTVDSLTGLSWPQGVYIVRMTGIDGRVQCGKICMY